MAGVTGSLRTDIPARLDRLPWSRFHWRIVIGLGAVWILDGLEVTIVGAVASRMIEPGSGITLTAADIGTGAALYVAGACIGALFFGQLTDRWGRKKLFMITLAVYLVATVATAFAFEPWFFFLCRFFTGFGIGGEYSAINSAIDELIPARNRGQVDLTINGSYWVGSGIGSLVALLLLDATLFAPSLGWRLAFGLGFIIGLGILLVRRHVPESPRWLLVHGRAREAERMVEGIEQEIRRETGVELQPPPYEIAVRVRQNIRYRDLVRIAFRRYPNRALLGLALFTGQAFLYNAVVFDLGTLLSGVFGVSSSSVPTYMVLFAASNFLGPLLLGRLFDTVGRIPMIAGTYLGSAVLVTVLGVLLGDGGLTTMSFMVLLLAAFFLASAGASSAYLTVSEVFPLEIRGLAIALFYATGTAAGGIAGPLLFGNFIHSGNLRLIALGFFIGAAAMAVGGLAELVLGVRAEGKSLENIATPLTAEEAEADPGEQASVRAAREPADATEDEHREARERNVRVTRRSGERAAQRPALRAVRLGPGSGFYSPGQIGTAGTTSRWAAASDEAMDREIAEIERAVDNNVPIRRRALASATGGRLWGPGRFRRALRQALSEGRVRRLSGDSYGPGRGRDSGRPAGAER
ncbi:major facilitator superfamily MFS_1 [Pseudonocardia dioxanivorans CB1190]|uniref:Major facilitator superfamily MFS_1 n=1 Tax=Pseudonocardia dioxanivorans (strain ATCC 55486 / DSM 44775 / JCM 13855 / CB1190) TaxID=675635 RepID=F4CZE0_PSEUX|nr:MFS transporter [Pseudonocardia dioxanivorans]AEA25671.1 major facilitator superfamily MFS_1 [Pseudonocardia dioxanivorans CB1190]